MNQTEELKQAITDLFLTGTDDDHDEDELLEAQPASARTAARAPAAARTAIFFMLMGCPFSVFSSQQTTR